MNFAVVFFQFLFWYPQICTELNFCSWNSFLFFSFLYKTTQVSVVDDRIHRKSSQWINALQNNGNKKMCTSAKPRFDQFCQWSCQQTQQTIVVRCVVVVVVVVVVPK